MRKPFRHASVILPVVMAAACGDDAMFSPSAGQALVGRAAGGRVAADTAFRITGAEQPLAVGQSVQLKLTSDVLRPSALRAPTWKSGDATALTVDGAGVATALRGGVTVTVTATTAAGVATAQVTTAAPATAPAAPAPVDTTAPPAPAPAPVTTAGAVTIPLTVTRFDGGTGPVLVSNAIPLQRGALRADGLRNVRVVVNGAEQPVYVEALRGLHPDGSLRSVLVQWRYSLGASSVPAALTLGTPRATADLSRPAESRSVPAAVALPAAPEYVVATGFAGPTVTEAASAAMPNVSNWDARFREFADYQWTQTRDEWGGNYYDRAHIYYVMWARTGNPTYWYRGTRMAVTYRTGYVEAYGTVSPHWAQIEGLGSHYATTGDTASLTAVGTIARTMGWWFENLGPEADASGVDSRIRARSLMAVFTLWKYAEPSAQPALATQLDGMLTASLRGQAANGGYPISAACGGTNNFMDGMLDDTLIKLYDEYKPDPRIPDAVRRSADYLWTQWNPTAKAIQYISVVCPNVGSPTDLWPALNTMSVNAFAWTYARTRDVTYRDRADALFAGTVYGANFFSSKEFNQTFHSSFRYLAYRR
jgi:hypothetical protein